MAATRHLPQLRLIQSLLRPHMEGERRPLLAGAALGIAIVVLHVARPWPLKWLVDRASMGHHAGPRWIPADPWIAVAVLGGLFVLLAAVGAAAEYGQVLLLNGSGNRILFRFRTRLFEHLLAQPLAYHERREIGELLTRVVYDTSRLRRGLNGLLVRVFQTLALFVATIAVAVWIQPALGLILAVAGTIALLTMGRRGRRIGKAAKRQRKKEGALAALVASELAGIRELHMSGTGSSAVLRRFGRRNERSLRQEQKVRRLAAGLTLRVDVLIAMGVALALGIGSHGAMAGTLTAGDLVLFLSYALTLRQPFVEFARQTGRVGRTYAVAERLARIVDRPLDVTDAPDAIDAPAFSGALRFGAVALRARRKVRTGRKWTLNDVTFDLAPGTRVAVVGGNGAGKSTILRLVLRLADPDRGVVEIDGRDARKYTTSSLRRQMSVVFQDVMLPALTVRELLAGGAMGANDGDLRDAAARAGALELIDRLPEGLDTPIRRGGDLLSGGERQRLAIAAALLRDGRIWLLDEPTSGLDASSSAAVVKELFSATSGRTTLWVTHDASLIGQFDRVLVLAKGRVRFMGDPAAYRSWLSSPAPVRPAGTAPTPAPA